MAFELGLTGLEIEPNGIMIALDGRGRVCGDGFVHFTSARSVDLALQRHKEKIKHRFGRGLSLVIGSGSFLFPLFRFPLDSCFERPPLSRLPFVNASFARIGNKLRLVFSVLSHL